MDEDRKQPEKIKSNDPRVIEFLKYLGVDTSVAKRVYVYIEEGGYVEVEEHRTARRPDF